MTCFRYVGHIRKRDGFLGLYAGLVPRMASLCVAQKVEDEFDKFWPPAEDSKEEEIDTAGEDDEDEIARLIEDAKRRSAKAVAVVLATQPLQVVAVRQMAQFVGGEAKYNGITGPFQVVKENGIMGLWSGWLPRALGDVCLVCLTSALTYVVNKYVITDKDLQQYTGHGVGFVTSSLVYPFTVVSNTMIVSRYGSQLNWVSASDARNIFCPL